MTCNEQSCHYAGECTDLDKQKQQSRPWTCSRYVKKGSPENFRYADQRGYL